jgi:hypothetical protein
VVPFLWSLIGVSAPINYGIYEDIGLVVAGVLSVGLLWWRDRQAAQPAVRDRVSRNPLLGCIR